MRADRSRAGEVERRAKELGVGFEDLHVRRYEARVILAWIAGEPWMERDRETNGRDLFFRCPDRVLVVLRDRYQGRAEDFRAAASDAEAKASAKRLAKAGASR